MQAAAVTHSRQDILPRGVIISIGILVLAALIGTAVVRLSGISIHEPDAAPLATRALRFADGADGSVLIFDAKTGQQAARITGEQGFLRGAMRALARERKRSGIGSEPPFELIARTDNRLTLSDPQTGQHIDLESFGPTNAGTFAKLLAGNAAPAPTP